jgi:hypothetical protein
MSMGSSDPSSPYLIGNRANIVTKIEGMESSKDVSYQAVYVFLGRLAIMAMVYIGDCIRDLKPRRGGQ